MIDAVIFLFSSRLLPLFLLFVELEQVGIELLIRAHFVLLDFVGYLDHHYTVRRKVAH